MSTATVTDLWSHLQGIEQEEWDNLILALSDSIHPVDREATRIWFAQWPLKLSRGLRQAENLDDLIRDWRLKGNFRLEEQLDHSIYFFYGSRFWSSVKAAVAGWSQSFETGQWKDLEAAIRHLASQVAEKSSVEESLTLGISAAGLMAFQQIGPADFQKWVEKQPLQNSGRQSPERILAQRARVGGGGLLQFFRGANRKFRITFDERDPRESVFYALQNQDVSMASASDQRDYQSADPRRLEGPVPFECRSGSCGFCWIGVLGGRERLAPITPFEVTRLRYFGYLAPDSPEEDHPPIRLACQSQCRGDIAIVISPWNGALDGRY